MFVIDEECNKTLLYYDSINDIYHTIYLKHGITFFTIKYAVAQKYRATNNIEINKCVL